MSQSKKSDIYQRIIDSIPGLIAYKNANGVYEIVSKSVDELYKDRFKTIVGSTIEEVYSKDAQRNVKKLDKEAIEKKEKTNQVFEAETDQGLVYMQATRTPFFDSKQNLLGVLSVSNDVSELIKATKSLELSNTIQKVIIEISQLFVNMSLSNYEEMILIGLKKLGEVIHSDRAYIFTYNFKENTMDNIFEWCNKNIEPEIDNLKGIPISDFLEGWVNKHRAGELVLIPNVDELDESSNLYQILKPQHIKSLFSMPIYIGQNCFGFIGFDSVFEYKNWDEIKEYFRIIPDLFSATFSKHQNMIELSAVKERALKATNSQADFLAKVTHELKTPMNGISNALYLMDETSLDEDQKQYVDIMTYSLETLSSMVYNILNYSKIEANKLTYKGTDCNLEHEVIKLMKMNKFMASNKGLGLYIDYDYNIPSVLSMDIEKLRQILNNILNNSIKYTNYGHVKIKVSLVQEHLPYVDVKFEIIDTGIGISEIDLKHIFDEFYQVGDSLNKNPSGTGLGLTITNDLISFLKGKLQVESEERIGTNFNFVLTFYSSSKEKIIPLDMSVLLIDISKGDHSNVERFLLEHFNDYRICNLTNCGDFYNHYFDILFIYTNDEKNYQESLSDLKPFIKSFKGKTKNILLYDNPKVAKHIEKCDYMDSNIELPAYSDHIIKSITTDTLQLDPAIKKSKDSIDNQVYQNRLTILLVDDNNINRLVMSKLLKNMNLGVAQAANGFDAIELVKQNKYDIIFMDIMMPGIDGYEASKRIRALEPSKSQVPIIAVTANDVESTLEKAIEYGMNGVLSKPLKKVELESLLNEYFPKEEFDILSKEEPIVDYTELESFYDDIEIRKEIIITFLSETTNDINSIENAWNLKSVKHIYKVAHYLKGSFTYLSAKKVLKLTKVIMNLCNEDRLEEALNLKHALILNYQDLVDELQKHLKQIE